MARIPSTKIAKKRISLSTQEAIYLVAVVPHQVFTVDWVVSLRAALEKSQMKKRVDLNLLMKVEKTNLRDNKAKIRVVSLEVLSPM